jgi:hypothetical protein
MKNEELKRRRGRANAIYRHLRGAGSVQEPIHRQAPISDVDVRDFWAEDSVELAARKVGLITTAEKSATRRKRAVPLWIASNRS